MIHVWIEYNGMKVCRACGVVLRKDKANMLTPCKKVKVKPRLERTRE